MAYIIDLKQLDKSGQAEAGCKAATLGELLRTGGLPVPAGFCLTTSAYQTTFAGHPRYEQLTARLAEYMAQNSEPPPELCGEIRQLILGTELPADVHGELASQLTKYPAAAAWAVRSSAAAEDLPAASFAGQYDTLLNVTGTAAVIRGVKQCWASLFSDRAVLYRRQQPQSRQGLCQAVLIQQFIAPRAAGMAFTADPLTSNRKALVISAGFGLGKGLTAGTVTADTYTVSAKGITARQIPAKTGGVFPAPDGGTELRVIAEELRNTSVLTNAETLSLAELCSQIAALCSCPQDIEWCLAANQFYILQSRPLTTLFPIPQTQDRKRHIYISIGHLRMMTAPFKPLGMSFFRFLTASQLQQAGGRFYGDISADLKTAFGRKILLQRTSQTDTLLHSALLGLLQQKNPLRGLAAGKPMFKRDQARAAWLKQAAQLTKTGDYAVIEQRLQHYESQLTELQQQLARLNGDALFAHILQDQPQARAMLNDALMNGAILAGTMALEKINKAIEKWLGEKNTAEILIKSLANNVTTAMGLALLDTADTLRKYPQVLAYLEQAEDETFFTGLSGLDGGRETASAIRTFLHKYGMRCQGEIDLTNPRWAEKPTRLWAALSSSMRNLKPGQHRQRIEQNRREAENKIRDITTRLQALPGGRRKARQFCKLASVLRTFAGCREYPRYFMIRRYAIYKERLMQEAASLVQRGVIRGQEDVFYLSFEEFRQAVLTGQTDLTLIAQRKAAYCTYETLTPPRVITSEGEVPAGAYATDTLPAGALPGVAVSTGIVEGRARIITNLAEADIGEHEILVTTFADPSWTPLFLTIRGLVTEVGGLMTHGAVIAREYGLPAVMGVEHALKRIKDGQLIRVNGDAGYVKILKD